MTPSARSAAGVQQTLEANRGYDEMVCIMEPGSIT
jgi:hypothetical protein